MTEESPTEAPALTRRSSRLASLTLVICALGVGLALSEIGARLLWPNWAEFYAGRFQDIIQQPGYGRTAIGRHNFDGYFSQNDGDFRVRIRINEAGFRELEPPTAADGKIWIIGDSLPFGWGVAYQKTFGALAAGMLGQKSYNLASPGANPCHYQAALARMPKNVTPVAVVVALTLENDVGMLNCPRGKANITAGTMKAEEANLSLSGAKLYLMENSALYNAVAIAVKQSPVIRNFLIERGLIAKPHIRKSSSIASAMVESVAATADEVAFIRSQIPDSVPFAVLVVPARFDLRDDDPALTALRDTFVTALGVLGITALDPSNEFKKAGFIPTHFAHDGHWSPKGHAVAAGVVALWLKKVLR